MYFGSCRTMCQRDLRYSARSEPVTMQILSASMYKQVTSSDVLQAVVRRMQDPQLLGEISITTSIESIEASKCRPSSR